MSKMRKSRMFRRLKQRFLLFDGKIPEKPRRTIKMCFAARQLGFVNSPAIR